MVQICEVVLYDVSDQKKMSAGCSLLQDRKTAENQVVRKPLGPSTVESQTKQLI